METYQLRIGVTQRFNVKRFRWAILFFLLALSFTGWAIVREYKYQHGGLTKAAIIDKAIDNNFPSSHFLLISEKGVCPTDPITWAKAKPGQEVTCEWLGER